MFRLMHTSQLAWIAVLVALSAYPSVGFGSPALQPAFVPDRLAAQSAAWQVPILEYHVVTDAAPYAADTSLFLQTKLFDAQLTALAKAGYRSITAADLGRAVKSGVSVPSRVVVLSFDDGRSELIHNAWPVMRQHGTSLYLRGGRWVSPDLNRDGIADIGYTGTFPVIVDRQAEPTWMSPADWATLAQAGNDIADHTMHHTPVATLSGAALTTAVVTAGDDINAALAAEGVSRQMVSFAYPEGSTSAAAVRLLRSAGFLAGLTSRGGIARAGDAMLLLPRVYVPRGMTAAQLMSAIR